MVILTFGNWLKFWAEQLATNLPLFHEQVQPEVADIQFDFSISIELAGLDWKTGAIQMKTSFRRSFKRTVLAAHLYQSGQGGLSSFLGFLRLRIFWYWLLRQETLFSA